MKKLLLNYDISLGDTSVDLVKLDTLTNFAREHQDVTFQISWSGLTGGALDGDLYCVVSQDDTRRVRMTAVVLNAANNTADNSTKIPVGNWTYVAVDLVVNTLTGGLLTVTASGNPIEMG